MNQFIPVESESGRVSRGYCESKPFIHPDSYKVFRSPTFQIEVDEESQREKDDLIRKQIQSAILDYFDCGFIKKSDAFNLTCVIMEVVKKGYGV